MQLGVDPDRGDQPDARADLGDLGHVGQWREHVGEVALQGAAALDEPVALEHVEVGECRRAAGRVPGVGRAVTEQGPLAAPEGLGDAPDTTTPPSGR